MRKGKKLKQSDVPGFSASTWGNYETGFSKPGLDDLLSISKYFGITETQLLHTDLSKLGNLISKKEDTENTKIGNLIGNRTGNLSPLLVEDFSRVEEEEIPLISRIRMPQVITIDTQGNENVVLVPVRARAGYLNGYADPEFMSKLPAYRLPGLNHGSFRLFEVEGLSMHPTLHGGDLVIGQNVEQLQDVRDDRVYVVVTKNDGVVVKRCLNRIQKDGKLILKSDNYKERDIYPSMVVDPSDILEMWYATGFISRQLRPPSEMYNRLIDLEGRLTLLEARKL